MERVIERFDLMRLTEPNDILVPEQEARVSYAYQRWFAELHAALGEGEVWQGAMQRYGYAVGRRLKVVYTLAWCGRPDPTESPLWQVALAWTMAHFDANQ